MVPSYAFRDQGEAASLVIPWNAAHDSLGYLPASNCDANHCEMWVSAITGETFAHSGAYNDTLRFSFAVDRESLVERQGGQVLTLGAYVHEPAGDSLVKAVGDELLLCVAVAVPFQVPFSEIGEFAFFLDIKRADERIDRVAEQRPLQLHARGSSQPRRQRRVTRRVVSLPRCRSFAAVQPEADVPAMTVLA
jgi:hypothetical protein